MTEEELAKLRDDFDRLVKAFAEQARRKVFWNCPQCAPGHYAVPDDGSREASERKAAHLAYHERKKRLQLDEVAEVLEQFRNVEVRGAS